MFQRLAKLTSESLELQDAPINWVYPEHAAALTVAGLKPKVWPTMRSLWDEERIRVEAERLKKEKVSNFDRRKVRFIVAYSKYWGQFIRVLLKKLRLEYKLPWLRVQFCYKRHAYLKE